MENSERDIEFRAWDADNKVMNSWISIQKNFRQYLESAKVSMSSGSNYDYSNNGKDKYILMQYTTRKDTKNVKMYESDILRNEKTGCLFTVVWSQKFLAWRAVIEDTEFFLNDLAQNAVVVGNIYEGIKRTRGHGVNCRHASPFLS